MDLVMNILEELRKCKIEIFFCIYRVNKYKQHTCKMNALIAQNLELKKTVQSQKIIINKCMYRIGELETHILAIDPNRINLLTFIQNLRITIKSKFTDSPPIIETEKIEKITDKYFLMDLELKYDNFISKNQHLLFLYDLIEDMLDIRDTILLRICRLERNERINKYIL